MSDVLMEVWQDTVRTAPPPLAASIKVVHSPRLRSTGRPSRVRVSVRDLDTFELAAQYARPLVMNLADDNFPGGWVADGACTQEESLFRRSNYFRTLTPEFYPVRDGEAVYSPQVTVIKDTAERHHLRLAEPFLVDLIACPGVKYPALVPPVPGVPGVPGVGAQLNETDVRRLTQKIELIFQVAEAFGHKTVIMGALGCGAWRCPPFHVATIVRSVIESFDWNIDDVVFGILRPRAHVVNPNLTNDNHAVFSRVFC